MNKCWFITGAVTSSNGHAHLSIGHGNLTAYTMYAVIATVPGDLGLLVRLLAGAVQRGLISLKGELMVSHWDSTVSCDKETLLAQGESLGAYQNVVHVVRDGRTEVIEWEVPTIVC